MVHSVLLVLSLEMVHSTTLKLSERLVHSLLLVLSSGHGSLLDRGTFSAPGSLFVDGAVL